jgi:hypothetical protein
MIRWIRLTWCKNIHTQAMWPMHGKYICSRCFCEHAVVWEAPGPYRPEAHPQVEQGVEAPRYAEQSYAEQHASASHV